MRDIYSGRIKRMLKKIVHTFGLFHIVIAISCMLIGVIVEFHQVHVYKNNISFWHLQATKTIGKDTKKYVQPITDFVKELDTHFFINDLVDYKNSVHFQLNENSIYSRRLTDLITPEYIYDKALRGPPVV